MIWGKMKREQDMYQWHVWFAWRPVRLEDGRWCWLERVKQCFSINEGGGGGWRRVPRDYFSR